MRVCRLLLAAAVGVLVPATTGAPGQASPAEQYSGPYFGDGNLPPGCIRDLSEANPDNICHHMRTGIRASALDSPQVDVLVLVPASAAAERDMRIVRQSVEMWEGGIDYLAREMGLDWLADGVDFHVTVDQVDPNGPGGEFTTYPVVDPEIVVVTANPSNGTGIGVDPVSLVSPLRLTTEDQVPCHGVSNPFDFEHWQTLSGFDSHHEGRSGTYVEDCGGAGGNICFAVVPALDPLPPTTDDGLPGLFDLASHEIGHCLTLGHVGDGNDGGWGVIPYDDIMSYDKQPPGLTKCVSTLDVEAFAVRMSRYLDVDDDGVVDAGDRLLANDQIGDGEPFQVQHPDDHLYASGTGFPFDCPQPDLGLLPGEQTTWTPTPVDTHQAVLTLTAPGDGTLSRDGTFRVTGTVEQHSLFDDPTESVGSHDDPDDDATHPVAEILRLDIEATSTHLDATIRLADLTPNAVPTGTTEYSVTIDGLKFDSTMNAQAAVNPFTDGNPVTTAPFGTSSWDFEAEAVSFHIPRDRLRSRGVHAPYSVTSEASVALHTVSVSSTDRAPDAGVRPVAVAGPEAAETDGAPATEHVHVYVDGVLVAGQDVDTADGHDSFAVPVDLAKGTHELRVEWEDDGKVLATRSVTVRARR